jgi:hypothetical protein
MVQKPTYACTACFPPRHCESTLADQIPTLSEQLEPIMSPDYAAVNAISERAHRNRLAGVRIGDMIQRVAAHLR